MPRSDSRASTSSRRRVTLDAGSSIDAIRSRAQRAGSDAGPDGRCAGERWQLRGPP
ncbi:hypothetical protein EAH80_04140 [Mycobacterium hodleri]|uniref:Uncharacterized protein n=1 Tax=Mycolicibacterium hodleri TaxID=49897 RepID=A0A502EKK9_9MYCO|nr:hypothetical protein EAH80_04140 [Mycolicibacterium hodleri]